MSDSKVLIIGAPSPLTLQVTGSLVATGEEVELLLARPDPLARPPELGAHRAVFAAMQRWVDGGQLSLLDGEPSAIDFGLPGAAYLQLVRRTQRLVCVVTADPLWTGDPENCRGVRVAAETLEFVRSGGATGGVTYLSSLLVFGNARLRAAESDLALGQGFMGSFEERLATAERMIRHAAPLTPVSVLRTAPIVGDLQTPQIYPGSVLDEVSRRVERMPPFAEVTFRNLPARFDTSERVVAALVAMVRHDEAVTAHLVDDQPPSDRQLVEWLADHHNRSLVEAQGGRGRRIKSPLDGLSSPERRAMSGWPLHFGRESAERLFPQLLDQPFEPLLERLFAANETTPNPEERA